MKGNQPLTYSPMFCYLVRTSKIRFAVPVRPKDSYCGHLLTKKHKVKKAYRNLRDMLLKEADTHPIRKA